MDNPKSGPFHGGLSAQDSITERAQEDVPCLTLTIKKECQKVQTPVSGFAPFSNIQTIGGAAFQ